MPAAQLHARFHAMAGLSVLLMAAVAFVSWFFPAGVVANETVVRIRCKQSDQDASHDYFIKLLELALRETEGKYGPWKVEVTGLNLVQGRALEELSLSHGIDVDWAGTNAEREERLRPIRIPLIGGLLGYRVPVILKYKVEEFSGIRSLAQLRRFTAVQGAHWPDADILESAGLPVHRVAEFGLMYPMLLRGRVEYFPRGVNEVYSEVAEVGDPNLVAFDSLLLFYRLPMYFFTERSNEILAARIEEGLRKAIDDGSFRRFMETHPVTAPLFPLSRFDESIVLFMPNPGLPEKTPLDDPSLWITIGRPLASE